MTFISYSQNFEDVLLWRALGHLPRGFYIDVGANDPELHSVTKAFYDAGWNGINIEPMPSYAQPFVEQRPRDINLNCAAGSASGEIVLFEVPSMNGWASTDPEVAAAHRADGYEVVENRVPLRTLADICAEHVQGEVHFLKIDVEGFEGEVLKGMDLKRWRPWVLVIEATLPGSRETNHEQWEGLVTPHGYQFVWFDGLNRYYVANEHPELAAQFGIQPNVFDAFISYHLDRAWADNKKLSARVKEHWQRVEDLSGQLQNSNERLQDTDQQLRKVGAQVSELDARLGAEQQARDKAAQQHQADMQAAQQAHAAAQQAAQQAHDAAQQAAQQAHDKALQAMQLARNAAQQAAQQARDLAQQNHEKFRAADARGQALDAQLQQVDAWGRDMEQQLLAMRASTSWRITHPLRVLMARGEHSVAFRARRKARRLAGQGLRWLTQREWLRRLLLPVIGSSPWLQRRVSRFLVTTRIATSDAAPYGVDVPSQQRDLPQSARKVLADLRGAYEHQEKQ